MERMHQLCTDAWCKNRSKYDERFEKKCSKWQHSKKRICEPLQKNILAFEAAIMADDI